MRALPAIFWILTGAGFAACSSNSGSGACRTQGFYADQASCSSITRTTCTLTTAQTSTDGKALICWKASSEALSVTTAGGTAGATSSGCSGTYSWSLGAWTPVACDGSAPVQVRTVTCPYSCPCNLPSTATPPNSSACTPDLFNQVHYSKQCTDRGGTIHITPAGEKICSLPGSSCPAGWTLHKTNNIAWTLTEKASARDKTNCFGGYNTVHTAFHAVLAAVPVESTTYCSSRNCVECRTRSTVYATVARVGCY